MRFKTIGVITVYSFCVFSFSSSQENNSNCSELYGCPTTDNEVFLWDDIIKERESLNKSLQKSLMMNRSKAIQKQEEYFRGLSEDEIRDTNKRIHGWTGSDKKVRYQNKEELMDSLEMNLDKVKFQCEDLGYKKGTEKFGECVLKLSE